MTCINKNKIPSQEKIIAFLSGFTVAVSLGNIKHHFKRYDGHALARYLRALAYQGVLIRTEKNSTASAFYRPAPSALGLISLPMWQVKIPAHHRSRKITFEGRQPVNSIAP